MGEATETVENAAEVGAEVVAPGSVETDPDDKPEYVMRSTFDAFKSEVFSKLDALATAAPAPADGDGDETPVKVPWTHRSFR